MKRFKIMIVDDEEDLREILEKAFQARDYATVTAGDGEKALRLLETEGIPDLIVLDVMMPHLDGWEFLKIVRDHSEYRNVKIMLLTAKNSSMDDLLGRRILKADDYLTKPFNIDRVIGAAERLLRGSFHAKNQE